MKYLVLGNGAAGITAAAKLRELDGSSPITIVSAEDTPAYTKIMLPDYIGGSMDRNKIFIRDNSYYIRNNIKFLTGKTVININSAGAEAIFSDGSSEPYDKLLIATGSIPFIPRIEGLDSIRFFTINSLKDADTIKNSVKSGENALVIGGGLTGIEMAFALRKLGMSVCIIEREKAILPQQLDEEASAVMEGYLQKASIHLFTGTAITSIAAGAANAGKGLAQKGTVLLANRERVNFGMLVATIGTRPRIDYAEASGIEFNKGILVDEFLKTSVKNIYAAGDVAESVRGMQNGFVSPYIWPNAMAQGKLAAMNMTGAEQAFGGTGYVHNMTQLRDMPYVSMGLVKPVQEGYEVLKDINNVNRIYRKFILKDNRIVGMILIGDVKNANTLASLIRNKTDASSFKSRLTQPDFKP